jgi:fusion protein PurCD
MIPNHFIDSPDPNVTVVRTVDVVPIEIIVRSYLTGTTSTSVWTAYERGERLFCGVDLADGMKKNQKLPELITTPTLKRDDGDVSISAEEILRDELVPENTWYQICNMALELFKFGQAHCERQGIILVDTKYEFGIDRETGDLIVCDEVHTPDSSRFWQLESYSTRFEEGLDPERLDKDSLRVYMNDHGTEESIPDGVMDDLSRSYIAAYEQITGKRFPITSEDNASDRIRENLCRYYEFES